MKHLFTIHGSLENKVSYAHLALFLALLPFDRFYSQLVLISFVLHTLIHINRQKIRLVPTRQNLLLTALFLLAVTGLAWSQEKKEGLKDIEHQLAILLFPLLLSVTSFPLRLYRKKLLLLFGLACTATVIYLYIDAFRIIAYYKLPVKTLLSGVFIHHNFSEPIGIHATYLSLYISLSIISFLHFFMEEKNRRAGFAYITVLLILSGGLVQLGSKSVIIASITFIIAGFPLFMPAGRQRIKFIITVSIIFLVSLLAITKIDSFKKRYVMELKGDLSASSADNIILEPRVIRWQSALALIKKAPVTGYGTGSGNKLLKEKYFEDKLYDSYLHKLNTHNQYLGFLLTTGIPGLLLFLAVLAAGFRMAWQSRDPAFTGFMILVSVVSFSENILDVNKGIFFFAFFLSFFAKTVALHLKKKPSARRKVKSMAKANHLLNKALPD